MNIPYMRKLKPYLDDIVYKVKNEDNDYFLAIIGEVRKGKSNLAMCIAKYCNPNFSLDDIVYSREQFVKRVERSKPGDVIIVDEGALVFYASDRGKGMNDVIKLATTMGQYNTIVITCVPKISLIAKYIRQDRLKTHISVFTVRGKKGNYAFFGKRATVRRVEQEQRGYMRKGEKKPQYIFRDVFGEYPDKEFFEAYKKRKMELTKVDSLKDKKEVTTDSLLQEKAYTKGKVARMVGVSDTTVGNWVKNGKIKVINLPNDLVRIPESEVLRLKTE